MGPLDTIQAGTQTFVASLSATPFSPPTETKSFVTKPIARLFVLGAFGLFDNNNRSYTPRMKKAQALLALIAMAPRGERTRVWLRDKLWSESSEDKSSTNLRQLIFELKKELGPLANNILVVTKQSIGLRQGSVWIDYWAVRDDPAALRTLEITRDTQVLEGLDIPDNEFDDWLSFERAAWHEKAQGLFDIIDQMPMAPQPLLLGGLPAPPIEPRFCIGLLPNIQQGCDGRTNHIADQLIESITLNLRELLPLEIFDLRNSTSSSLGLIGGEETEFYIRVRTLQVRTSLTITFFLYNASRMTLEWSQSIQLNLEDLADSEAHVIAGFITQNVDRMARTLERAAQRDSDQTVQPMLTSYVALNMMFRLDNSALTTAEALLMKMDEHKNNAIAQSLLAYSASFKVGEAIGEANDQSLRDVRTAAQHAIDGAPFNSIALASLAHTMGYVFGEHAYAADLLERALKLNQFQPFVWDHYALHKLYIGDYHAANAAAQRAVYLGSFSPLSYSYDTTLAMTATLVGDTKRAILSAQNALSKQPRFKAAQRYLVANLSMAGRREEAFSAYQNLLKTDPDFEHLDVQKQRFRLSNDDGANTLINAINQIKE